MIRMLKNVKLCGAHPKLLLKSLVILFACSSADTLFSAPRLRSCTSSWNGAKGVCRPLSECPNFRAAGASQNRRPDLCMPGGNMPIICCVPEKPLSLVEQVEPLSLSSITRKVAPGRKPLWLEKCMEYTQFIYEKENSDLQPRASQCVQSSKQSAGVAKFGEFPHMAAVGYEEDSDISFKCGGSLISERYVLTAAHCVYGSRTSGRPRWVLLGEVSLNQTKKAVQQLIRVSQLIVHPDYKAPEKYFDVGLLQLAFSPRLGPYLRPACLPSDRATQNQELVVTGWGAVDFAGNQSDLLLKVTLLEAPYDECSEEYSKRRLLRLGLHNASMMCAGRPDSRADSCQGDSGGPLQAASSDLYCMYEVIGVVSFGKQCGRGVPGVYSRVEYFRSWIEDVVWS